MNELKADLQGMFNKSGLKDDGILFLFTEGQISNEKFLVYINDLLSSGEIADLYADEDKDQIINNIRPAVKGEGLIDNPENCWRYFIGRVKKNLHMAICFSPVGENFRQRARKFPAIVNCTVIDWFQPWPLTALLSVARKFTNDVDLGTDEQRKAIVEFMPYSFGRVGIASQQILEAERRYVYTTPKSFLELIKLYITMLNKTRNDLNTAWDNYESGVIKLKKTGEEVDVLQEELKIKAVEVEAKKEVADAQAEIIGVEKAKVEIENDKANIEATKCLEIKVRVDAELAVVQKELDAALPLIEKAQAALQGLSVKDF